MNKVFEKIKVVELASVLAGPAVGMFFAELGATVIKIENKRVGGDVTRSWRLAKESPINRLSAYYCAINWNKETLFLDLSDPQDKEQLYSLIKEADIVINNYKKASSQKLGVDYNTLKNINPQIIYANLSGFGEQSNRVAFDVVLQAESGFMFMNGQAGSPPTKMPVALIDLLAAHQLKEGVLVALIGRMKTGKGAYVSVSLIDAAIASLANQATNWLMAGHIPVQMGSLHPNIAPYGELFKTKDNKYLVLSIGNNKQFKNLCFCLNLPHLATDKLFETNSDRVKNRIALAKELKRAFGKVEASSILAIFHDNQVPVGLVRNMKEVFEQESAKKMIRKETVDGQLTQRVKTVVFDIIQE